jgi:hypothetical protein
MRFYSDIIIVILNLPGKHITAPGVSRDATTEVHRPIKTGMSDFTELLTCPGLIPGRIMMGNLYDSGNRQPAANTLYHALKFLYKIKLS